MANSPIPGPKILLVGATGSGKTHAIRLAIAAGLEVCAIFTEPGMEIVGDISCAQGLHWHYIPPATPDWKDMIDSATKINQLSFEQLTKLSDINKRKYTEFIDLLQTLSNFRCSRCGKTFGPVDSWPTGRLLFIDSLSGINIMAMNLVAGSKPVKAIPDWGVAMDNLERLLTRLTTSVHSPVVLTAHLEREVDEISGGVQLMASTLGRKLAPRIPRFFSDVVHARREGDKWFWSTTTMNVDLKARNLPLSDKLTPDFGQLLAAWQSRGGVIERTEPDGTPSVASSPSNP